MNLKIFSCSRWKAQSADHWSPRSLCAAQIRFAFNENLLNVAFNGHPISGQVQEVRWLTVRRDLWKITYLSPIGKTIFIDVWKSSNDFPMNLSPIGMMDRPAIFMNSMDFLRWTTLWYQESYLSMIDRFCIFLWDTIKEDLGHWRKDWPEINQSR